MMFCKSNWDEAPLKDLLHCLNGIDSTSEAARPGQLSTPFFSDAASLKLSSRLVEKLHTFKN